MFFSSIPLFDVQILKNIFSIENCSNVGLKLVSILPSVYGTEAVCSVVFHIATSASVNTSVFYYLEYLWTQMARANIKTTVLSIICHCKKNSTSTEIYSYNINSLSR